MEGTDRTCETINGLLVRSVLMQSAIIGNKSIDVMPPVIPNFCYCFHKRFLGEAGAVKRTDVCNTTELAGSLAEQCQRSGLLDILYIDMCEFCSSVRVCIRQMEFGIFFCTKDFLYYKLI